MLTDILSRSNHACQHINYNNIQQNYTQMHLVYTCIIDTIVGMVQVHTCIYVHISNIMNGLIYIYVLRYMSQMTAHTENN